jgi:hypothetical protein
MGYDFDYNVAGAMIVASSSDIEPEII